MTSFKDFRANEAGESSMVIKLVVAVTIAAAAMIIILQIMHVNSDTTQAATQTLKNGSRQAFTESMKTLAG